jgi:hypothetical protein
MRWFVGIVVALLVGTAIYVASAVVTLRGLIESARAGDGQGSLLAPIRPAYGGLWSIKLCRPTWRDWAAAGP